MDFSENELGSTILVHALFGLSRENLISPLGWAYGDADKLRWVNRQRGYTGSERGLIVSPSGPGAELFLNAMGVGTYPINIFLHQGISFGPLEGIVIAPGSLSLISQPPLVSQ